MMIHNSKAYSHSSDNSGFWRKLWNLKVQPKIKNFLWIAATGCLLTKDRLRARKVEVNVMCSNWNDNPESITHTLVTCSFA